MAGRTAKLQHPRPKKSPHFFAVTRWGLGHSGDFRPRAQQRMRTQAAPLCSLSDMLWETGVRG